MVARWRELKHRLRLIRFQQVATLRQGQRLCGIDNHDRFSIREGIAPCRFCGARL